MVGNRHSIERKEKLKHNYTTPQEIQPQRWRSEDSLEYDLTITITIIPQLYFITIRV